MNHSRTFSYREVEAIPEQLEPGTIYHAPHYATAAHLCACGCGWEVTMGIGPGRWRLHVTDGRATLRPSIGNGSFPCRSHYFISNGEVHWTSDYTDDVIAWARLRDNPRAHARAYEPAPIPTFCERVAAFLRWLVERTTVSTSQRRISTRLAEIFGPHRAPRLGALLIVSWMRRWLNVRQR